jgi:hypothetical protein
MQQIKKKKEKKKKKKTKKDPHLKPSHRSLSSKPKTQPSAPESIHWPASPCVRRGSGVTPLRTNRSALKTLMKIVMTRLKSICNALEFVFNASKLVFGFKTKTYR